MEEGIALVKICVIDSGCDVSKFNNCLVSGFTFSGNDTDGYTVIWDEFNDQNGHGTAVAESIIEVCSDIEFIFCKIFKETAEAEESLYIFALEYIRDNIKCDILHMSIGLTQVAQLSKLRSICYDIYKSGCVLVSAFDNMGNVSYPAAFDFVIGVDSCNVPVNKSSFTYVNNSIVNILYNTGLRRVSLNEKTIIVGGSSFAAARITGIISSQLNAGVRTTKIHEVLQQNATVTRSPIANRLIVTENIIEKIKKAIVFPFNKEMHSVVRFSNELPFKLCGVFDVRQSGKIGKTASSILGSQITDIKIQDYKDIDWNSDFDTVIVGHINELSRVLNMSIIKEFIKKAKRYKKTLLAFDSGIDPDVLSLSSIIKMGPHKDSFGKFAQISSPVIGIFGTSPSQGKFTLQMMLRNRFVSDGYKVGQLGTEPQAFLFNFDCVLPYGFNSALFSLDLNEFALIVNRMIHEIDCKGVDLIICGAQSGVTHYELKNITQATFHQMVFVHASSPDASVLCVNPYDDLEYIERSIKLLESSSGNKVCAIVLFPVDKQFLSFGNTKKFPFSTEKCEHVLDNLNRYFSIPVFLHDSNGVNQLYQNLLDFLSE